MNSPAHRYPVAQLDMLERARSLHRRAETHLRDMQREFCRTVRDWQETTGADRALYRGAVLDALDALRDARGDVLLACWAMGGACRAVEGVRG